MKQSFHNHKWLKLLREYAWRCQERRCLYCFCELRRDYITAEHKRPRSKGGGNNYENIGAACLHCNRAKGSMSVAAFKKALGHGDGTLALKVQGSIRRINLAADRACRRVKVAAQ